MSVKAGISNRFISFPARITGFFFIILFLILSFHSRIASDDFYYLYLSDKFGAWNGMLYQYQLWSGRWSAHFFACLLLKIHTLPYFLFFVYIFTLLVMYLAFRKSFLLLHSYLQLSIPTNLINELTLLIITSFYFSTYSIGETWYWFIIVITYLWSLISFFIILNNVFSKKQGFLNYLFLILAALFSGGASESYAIISIVLLLTILVYRLKILSVSLKDFTSSRLILAIVIITISLSFSAFAPGTSIRYSMLPHPPFLEKLWIALKALLKFFIRYLPQKIFYLTLFSLPWLFIGSFSGNEKYQKFRMRIQLLNSTIIFLLLIVLMFIPTAIIMSETGPDRALSVISLTTSIYFAIVFYLLGTGINFQDKRSKVFILVSGTLIGVFLCLTIYNQYSITKYFSSAYENRISILQENKINRQSLIMELEKLPSSGMLYWEEISKDTSYFVNQHLRLGLDLPFSVKLK